MLLQPQLVNHKSAGVAFYVYSIPANEAFAGRCNILQQHTIFLLNMGNERAFRIYYS